MTRINRLTLLAWVLCVGALAPPAQSANYIIDRDVLVPTEDGAKLCALIVRPAGVARRPTALEFTIYVNPEGDLERLEYAADRGYAGVLAYVRGKACSPQSIAPYEHDGRDANSVIDWIASQPWSDGQVGMMGGSYDGFTQWAAAKLANRHLETIVPVVPNDPANGLPMQNNVFILANYAWIYYTTDDKALDESAYR